MIAATWGEDEIALTRRRAQIEEIAAARRTARLAVARQREEALIAGADRLTQRCVAAARAVARHSQARQRRATAQRESW